MNVKFVTYNMGIQMNSIKNIRKTGLKATLPRIKILALFNSSTKRHLNAEDIYKLLQNDDMEIGLATIYRVLTQFEQAELLIRHTFEKGKAVFELNEGHHHDHIVCLECGKVEEFYDAEIESRQTKIAEELGFSLQNHSLHLYGNCKKSNCENKN